jgi:hypothetical protein
MRTMPHRSPVSLLVVGLLSCLAATAHGPTASAQPAAAASPRIVLGPHPLLFVDDSGVASSDGAVRRIHAARTRTSPVVEAEHPWEGARVYTYGSVYASPGGGYRMWYGSRPIQESPTQRDGKVPGLRGNGFDVVLYAESKDGVSWQKPALGKFAWEGRTSTNIIYDLHSPSVLLDLRETDAAKRYKMLGTFRGKYYAAYSADGLTWTDYPSNPVLDHSDTITMAQDPFTGEYLAFHKKPATVRGHPRRVVWLSRSADMQRWSEPELVFAPDAHDDAWTRAPHERTEVYNMSVYPHAAGFIGLPTIFRVTKERARDAIAPGQSPVDGPIDVELATSVDGRTWHRTSRREVVIPRGAPGTFDAGSILGVTSVPVHTPSETWVYYTAITTGHGAPLPEKRITVGRAEWRRHGFASLDAGPDGGVVTTRPLTLGAPELIVNADASRGRLCVAVEEADGRPIVGLGFDDCVALSRNETAWPARWTGNARPPTDRPVRLSMRLVNARLFSLDAR